MIQELEAAEEEASMEDKIRKDFKTTKRPLICLKVGSLRNRYVLQQIDRCRRTLSFYLSSPMIALICFALTIQESAAAVEEEEEAIEVKKFCTGCKTTKTPLWRVGPSGPKVNDVVLHFVLSLSLMRISLFCLVPLQRVWNKVQKEEEDNAAAAAG